MNKPCRNCAYHHGDHNIHCAIHPNGRPDRHCSDWSKLKLRDRINKTLRTFTPKDWIYTIFLLYSPGIMCLYTIKDLPYFTPERFFLIASVLYLWMAIGHFSMSIFFKDNITKVIAIANLLLAGAFGLIWMAVGTL